MGGDSVTANPSASSTRSANNCSDLMASETIISLLIVVDESADADQCKQDGVTRCRGVIVNDLVLKTLGVGDKLDMDKELKNLKEGDKLNLVTGESILMTLRRDTEVTPSGGVSLTFALDDGGEGNLVIGKDGSMYGSVKPLDGEVHFTLESCGQAKTRPFKSIFSALTNLTIDFD